MLLGRSLLPFGPYFLLLRRSRREVARMSISLRKGTKKERAHSKALYRKEKPIETLNTTT